MVFDLRKDRVWIENLVLVSQLGFTMAGSILFCFVIGLYLDRWLGTKGLFTILFIFLGVFGGGVTVYRRILDITESETNSRSNSDNGVG